ncbi:MAG: NYN domain-containing protein [Paracoccaceae bacterium]
MTTRVAVLVDGDNISGKHAAEIARIAGQKGTAQFRRVYLDAQRASDWHDATGFRLVHAGAGKNASDILLSIDAVGLALRDGIDNFVIATSDRDFSHIALRLQEYGATVSGIGEAKAPAAFRHACQTFVQIGPTPAIALVPTPSITVPKLDLQIRAVIAEHSQKGTGISIVMLNEEMTRRHATKIGASPEGTWRAYLQARPGLYDLDPRGPEARVRFRPSGFTQFPAGLDRETQPPQAAKAETA